MKTSLTDSSKQSLSSEGQGCRFILALGSNAGQEEAMALALRLLSRHLDVEKRTKAVWTEAVAGATGRFLNCLVSGRTAMGLAELNAFAKAVERQCGRTPCEAAAGLIRMDIDIMEYGGARLHAADWERTYIKQLMREL